MKYSLISFLLLFLCYTLNAKPGFKNVNSSSSNQLIESKILEIDHELDEAISVNDFQKLALHILEFINLNDTCPEPKPHNFKLICGDLVTKAKVPIEEMEFFEYIYEKRLLQMACVNIGVDNEETIKKKIQFWWNKYKTHCKCDSTTFSVPNGNILKFALSQREEGFIEMLVENYNLDINFIDPADNLNLLDYQNVEISKRKTDGSSKATIELYEKVRSRLISLGAKSSK